MTFCNYLEGKILDYVFGYTAFNTNITLYFGLATAVAEDGTITGEPSSGNYSRPSDGNDKDLWTDASGAGAISNEVAITFPTANASWGTLDTFFISDASSGNTNTWAYGDLTEAKTIGSGDTPKFNANDLDITLD